MSKIHYEEIPDELVTAENLKGNVIHLYDKRYKISRFDIKNNCYVVVEFGGLNDEEATKDKEMSA